MKNRLGSKDPLSVSEAAHPHDAYDTPLSLAIAICEMSQNIINHRGITDDYVILDPGCGDFGVFGFAANFVFGHRAKSIEGVDIRDVPKRRWYSRQLNETDYLKRSWNNNPSVTNPDLIIGNPPFELAEEFIRHSIANVSERGIIMFLLRSAWATTVGRCAPTGIHRTHPFHVMFNIPKRPSWWLYKRPATRGDRPVSTTNTVDYSVFFYTKDPAITQPELDWIYWDINKPIENFFRTSIGLDLAY